MLVDDLLENVESHRHPGTLSSFLSRVISCRADCDIKGREAPRGVRPIQRHGRHSRHHIILASGRLLSSFCYCGLNKGTKKPAASTSTRHINSTSHIVTPCHTFSIVLRLSRCEALSSVRARRRNAWVGAPNSAICGTDQQHA